MTIKELLDGVKEVIKRASVAAEEKKKQQTDVEKTETAEQEKPLELPKKKTYEAPEFTKLDEGGATDEQIADRAKGDLFDYASASRSAISDAYENAVKQAEKSKKSGEEAYRSAVEATDSAYDEAKRNLGDALIRRGMAKSSTAALLERDVDLDRARKTSEAANRYAETVAALDNEIAKAESERDAALKNFDIEYAVKYAKRIAELSKERDDKREEAIKYNNSLAEKKADGEMSADKASSDLYGKDLDNVSKAVSATEALNKQAKDDDAGKAMSLARYVLSKMPRAQAAKALMTDRVYAENLTAKQYAALLDEYGVRA